MFLSFLCVSLHRNTVSIYNYLLKRYFSPAPNSQFKYGKKTNKNKKTKTETVESYEKPFSNRHTHTNQPLRLLYTNVNLQFTDVLHFFFDYHTLHKNALCARLGFIHLLLFILSIGTTSGKS